MPTNFTGLEVKFEVGGITYHATLEDDIEIDQNDLNTEFMNQPKKFAWWAVLSELAKDKSATLKNQLGRLYAKLDHQVRTEAQNGKVKLTEKMVENTVTDKAEYNDLLAELTKARNEHGMLSAGREAFVQRKEMLISLGANYRMEGNQDPIVAQEKVRTKAQVIVDQKAQEGAQREAARAKAREDAGGAEVLSLVQELPQAAVQTKPVRTPIRTPIRKTTRQPMKKAVA